MYGQNNGNGQGNGQWQTGMFDAAVARLDNTRPVGPPRDPFIGPGDHLLMVLETQPYSNEKDGPCMRATFEVVESRVHQPGSRVCKIWKLARPSKFPSQPTDADHFADMVRKLAGAPEGTQVGAICAAVIRDRVADQVLRGMYVKAYGSENAKKNYVNVTWTSVQQSEEQIKIRRAACDAKMGQPQPEPSMPSYAQQASQFANFGGQPPAPQGYAQQYQQQPMPPAAPQYQVQAVPPAHLPPTPMQYAPQPPATTPVQYAPTQTAAPAAPGPLLSQIPGFNR